MFGPRAGIGVSAAGAASALNPYATTIKITPTAADVPLVAAGTGGSFLAANAINNGGSTGRAGDALSRQNGALTSLAGLYFVRRTQPIARRAVGWRFEALARFQPGVVSPGACFAGFASAGEFDAVRVWTNTSAGVGFLSAGGSNELRFVAGSTSGQVLVGLAGLNPAFAAPAGLVYMRAEVSALAQSVIRWRAIDLTTGADTQEQATTLPGGPPLDSVQCYGEQASAGGAMLSCGAVITVGVAS